MAARFIALCVLFLIVMSMGFTSAPVQAQNLVTCPEVVQRAIGAVGGNCGALDRNSACYGFQSVSAEFSQVQPAGYFSTPSDRARLIDIERIGTSPLDEALEQWGIALMSVQANLPNTLPGQSVVFMLLGDSKVENAVAPEDALQGGTTLDITLSSDAPLHQDPAEASPVLATVPAGTSLTADAISEDGDWLRVVYQGIPGWVPSAAGSTDGDLTSLEAIGPDSSTPMQSFYFQSGITSTDCVEAPNALVVQGPQNLTVDIQANGADIQLGSTIVLYQVPVDAETQAFLTQQYGIGNVPMLLQIVVLDGHVVLNKGTPEQIELNTGETTFRCLSDTQNLGVNGLSDDREVIEGCPWAEPRPVTISEVEPYRYLENLPLNYPIKLPLQLPPPLTTTVVELPEPTNTPQPTATVTPLPTATPTDAITAEPAALETEVASVFVPPSPPIAIEDSAATNEDTLVTIAVLANDVDLNFDPLTVTSTSGGLAGSTITHDATTVTYKPPSDYSGTDSFTYTVSDGNGGTDTATVNVTIHPVNDPPDAVDDSATTTPGVTVCVRILSNDNNDLELDGINFDSFTPVSANGGSVYRYDDIELGILLCYTSDPSFTGPTDTFTYTITDDFGAPDTATVTITLGDNTPPNAGDDTATTNEEVPVTIPVLDNDSDAEDGFMIIGTTTPSDGSVTIAPDGFTLTYTPDASFTGTDSFDYTIQDAGGAQDTATVTVTVDPGNSAPTPADDTAFTTVDVPVTVDVLNNDTDPDPGNVLTIVGVTNGSDGTVSFTSSDLTYFPGSGFVGTDSFTYAVSDGSLTASATVRVTVDANDPPNAVDDSATTDEDTAITISVLNNDSDPDLSPPDFLTVNSVCTPPSLGSAYTDGTTVTFYPDGIGSGSDTFCYEITDGHGHFVSANITVTVTAINDAPFVTDDTYYTLQDTLLDVPSASGVLANDLDLEGNPFTAILDTNVTNGTLTFNADGSFTYMPNPGFSNDSDTFTYHTDDGVGGVSGPATVMIFVGENSAPVANPDAYTMLVNGTLTVPAPGVLGNDLDPDGLGLTVVPGGATSNGALALNTDGSFTYTPDADFVGIDSFTYQASDGLDSSSATTVRIGVGVSSLVAPSTRRSLPYPTQTPLAPFIDYTYLDEMVRSSVPEALRYTVFGRMIVRNRVLLPSLNYGYIGDQSLIDMGIIHAIDIFSTDSVTDYGVGVGVCMKGQGRLFFLNANFTPRSPIELDWSYVDGYTCGTILAPGIVVLVDG